MLVFDLIDLIGYILVFVMITYNSQFGYSTDILLYSLSHNTRWLKALQVFCQIPYIHHINTNFTCSISAFEYIFSLYHLEQTDIRIITITGKFKYHIVRSTFILLFKDVYIYIIDNGVGNIYVYIMKSYINKSNIYISF